MSDLEGLKGAHESRNPLIARVLREHRFMRELGEGMRRIFEAMEQNDLERPVLVSEGSSFSVILRNRSVFNQREEEWLGLFQSNELSRLQKRIVVAGIDGKELSPDDIYRAMNTTDRDTYDFEVTGLRKSGILAEIRGNAAAQQIARQKRIDKGRVARFRVSQPSSATPSQQVRALPVTLRKERELFPEESGIFIGDLAPQISEEDLRPVFQRFGRVRKVLIRQNAFGTKDRYAVVWLENSAEVARALDALYGFKLNGIELVMSRFRAKAQRTRIRRSAHR